MKLNKELIFENLMYATLTCKQISLITGQSIYASKKIRLKIIELYSDKFYYSNESKVRTEHFVEYYKNPVITEIYNDIYELKSLRIKKSSKMMKLQKYSNLHTFDNSKNPYTITQKKENQNDIKYL